MNGVGRLVLKLPRESDSVTTLLYLWEEGFFDWALRPAGSHQIGAAEGIIDDVVVSVVVNLSNSVLKGRDVAALEQEVVKL